MTLWILLGVAFIFLVYITAIEIRKWLTAGDSEAAKEAMEILGEMDE